MRIERKTGPGIFNNSHVRGELSASAKLKPAQVVRIWHMVHRGELTITEVARRGRTTESNVRNIRDRRTWKHVTKGLGKPTAGTFSTWNSNQGERNALAGMTDAKARKVFKDAHSGMRVIDVAKKHGIHPETASAIKGRRRYARATTGMKKEEPK